MHSGKTYMEVVDDSKVFSLVGGRMQQVGEIKADYQLEILGSDQDYYRFQFGYTEGYIAKQALKSLLVDRSTSNNLRLLSRPLKNINLVTTAPVSVYANANKRSQVIAKLAGNLRYPISGKQLDKSRTGWYEIRLGGQVGFILQDQSELDAGVPVLTYHHLLRDEENKLFRHTSTTTSDTAFIAQMRYLKQAGYQVISIAQLERYLNNQINLPGKAVVLTFDDGLKSVYRYAYPVLKNLDFQATAFVISSRIKRHPQPWDPNSLQFMSVGELEKIQDVFDIQTHTHFLHRVVAKHQPILLVLSYHNILYDFERSRRALAQFNPDVLYLAYPFGGYNQTAIDAARDAGLKLAFTTVQGKVKPGDNPYTLKRLYILRMDPIALMAERLGNGEQSTYNFVGE